MKYWLVDSIPISNVASVQKLVDRLNQLEEAGYNIEGIEFYGENRDQCLVISNKQAKEKRKVTVSGYEDYEEPDIENL